MNHLSDLVLGITESATIAMSQRSRELQSKGIDVINLSLGEPDFDTPEFIKTAAKQAIDDGYSHYTPVPGYVELRETICQKLWRDNKIDYHPNQIVCSTGAKHSIINVLLSIINPGDEVIIPAPYWVSYSEMVQIAGGKPVIVKADFDADYKVTAGQIEAAITLKTKAFLFSSPCNPSGSVYGKEELESFAKVFAKNPQIVIISDEIYEYINFEGSHQSISQFAEIKDQLVIVNGLSKGFAMTGWRLGYIAAPLQIAQACGKIQGQFTSGTSSITQRAAIAALSGPKTDSLIMCDAFKRRREIVYNGLKKIPGIKPNYPKGAFYVFPDISQLLGKSFENDYIKDSDDLALYLLSHGHVATVGGSSFGSPECLRISYAASDNDLHKAIERIKNAVADLN
jgi:aspartate aminotransferase